MVQSAPHRPLPDRSPLARRIPIAGIECGAGCGGWSSRHGFARVECLAERVGYIDLRAFHAAPLARVTAIAALRLLEHVDVLILDLQRNRGGDETMAALLTSLLFDTEPLYEEEWLPSGAIPATVAPEPRCRRQRVEVLVSRDTSALGRAFAVNLERLARASMVGPVPRRPPIRSAS